MNPARFDRLVVSLGTAASRRAALRAAAGAVGWAIARSASPVAAACSGAGARCGDCCDGLTCCRGRGGKRCRDLLTDAQHCGACGTRCAKGQSCIHGACTCDPFHNTCPNDETGQCTCGAIVANTFTAACADRDSACDLDKPCFTNDDCPAGSVCLLGCREDDPVTNNRCSNPCIPVR